MHWKMVATSATIFDPGGGPQPKVDQGKGEKMEEAIGELMGVLAFMQHKVINEQN